NVAFLLDANAVYFGTGQVRARSGGLLAAMAAMGDIDAAMSVASFRAETDGWVRPHFVAPDASAMMTGIRHPLVPHAVSNSITLGPPHAAASGDRTISSLARATTSSRSTRCSSCCE